MPPVVLTIWTSVERLVARKLLSSAPALAHNPITWSRKQ